MRSSWKSTWVSTWYFWRRIIRDMSTWFHFCRTWVRSFLALGKVCCQRMSKFLHGKNCVSFFAVKVLMSFESTSFWRKLPLRFVSWSSWASVLVFLTRWTLSSVGWCRLCSKCCRMRIFRFCRDWHDDWRIALYKVSLSTIVPSVQTQDWVVVTLILCNFLIESLSHWEGWYVVKFWILLGRYFWV